MAHTVIKVNTPKDGLRFAAHSFLRKYPDKVFENSEGRYCLRQHKLPQYLYTDGLTLLWSEPFLYASGDEEYVKCIGDITLWRYRVDRPSTTLSMPVQTSDSEPRS
jgi:hypothetical protein